MTKKIFVIAGEASGDMLGSKLIHELKLELLAKNEVAEFIGVGGKLMQEQGLISIFPMEELSVMGFTEVLPHLPKLLRRINQTAETIIAQKPDFVITIDSPDFCFRVLKKLRDFKSAKKIHFIAPSVWAYREGRAEKISKLYDLLLCILPFEPPYFERHGLKTVFIGHPLLSDLPNFAEKKSLAQNFRKAHAISEDEVVISLTPGSRNGEVKKIFPEFIGAINLLAEKKSNLKVIIPLVDKTRALVSEMAKNLKVEYFLIEKEEKKSAFFATNFALAKSGTNTLEFSLYRIPMLIAYKVNYLSYFLIKMMIKTKFGNLLNLIVNREIIPEFLQMDCQAEKIFAKLEKLISDKDYAEKQLNESATALKIMGLGTLENPARTAAEEILKN